MAWKVTTAPAETPVTLTEARNHLKEPPTDDYALITRQIEAATQYLEYFTGRKFITQTVTEYWDTWPDGNIELSVFPVQSVSSLKYLDTNGTLQTWDAANYVTDLVSRKCRIAPAYNVTWPSIREQINAIQVAYVVGYGAAAAVDAKIKAAILLIVGELYENREDKVHTLPTRAIDLIMRIADIPL